MGHLGAVSLKKSHDIIILSFCNIVNGQAIYLICMVPTSALPSFPKYYLSIKTEKIYTICKLSLFDWGIIVL